MNVNIHHSVFFDLNPIAGQAACVPPRGMVEALPSVTAGNETKR